MDGVPLLWQRPPPVLIGIVSTADILPLISLLSTLGATSLGRPMATQSSSSSLYMTPGLSFALAPANDPCPVKNSAVAKELADLLGTRSLLATTQSSLSS